MSKRTVQNLRDWINEERAELAHIGDVQDAIDSIYKKDEALKALRAPIKLAFYGPELDRWMKIINEALK